MSRITLEHKQILHRFRGHYCRHYSPSARNFVTGANVIPDEIGVKLFCFSKRRRNSLLPRQSQNWRVFAASHICLVAPDAEKYERSDRKGSPYKHRNVGGATRDSRVGIRLLTFLRWYPGAVQQCGRQCQPAAFVNASPYHIHRWRGRNKQHESLGYNQISRKYWQSHPYDVVQPVQCHPGKEPIPQVQKCERKRRND